MSHTPPPNFTSQFTASTSSSSTSPRPSRPTTPLTTPTSERPPLSVSRSSPSSPSPSTSIVTSARLLPSYSQSITPPAYGFPSGTTTTTNTNGFPIETTIMEDTTKQRNGAPAGDGIGNGDFKLSIPSDHSSPSGTSSGRSPTLPNGSGGGGGGLPLPGVMRGSGLTGGEEGWKSSPVLPIFSYCSASIVMTVVNKFVVSGRDFNMTFLLCTIQSAVCVSVVILTKRLRIISFRDFDATDARRWAPISFCLVGVIYSGSKSLQYLKIPVYTIFKNLTIILIAYGEVLWFGGHVTGITLVSFGLMVLSSLIAAWSDIAHALSQVPSLSTTATLDTTVAAPVVDGDLEAQSRLQSITAAVAKVNAGYFWMALNCCLSAGYLLAMRKRIKLTGFKDWDTMFYNNLLSIPFLLVFTFLFEDWSKESLNRNFPEPGRRFLLSMMIFSGAAAVFISYSTAWCVRITSSTTYSMVGALNKLPMAASGMIFFGDPVTPGSVAAVGTGFVAGVVYAVAKNNQKTTKVTPGQGIEMKPRS